MFTIMTCVKTIFTRILFITSYTLWHMCVVEFPRYKSFAFYRGLFVYKCCCRSAIGRLMWVYHHVLIAMVEDNSEIIDAMLKNHSGERDPTGNATTSTQEPTNSNPLWANVDVSENPRTYVDGTIVRSRDEINDKFLDVVNAVEPEHPFKDDPYPLTHDDVKYSYCQSSGRYYAKCGPQRYGNRAFFAADKEYLGSVTKERLYVVLIHEATHITEGSHTSGSAHNPTFWKKFAKNCKKFVEDAAVVLDIDEFVGHAREDPNASMVDRRMLTVEEQKQRIEDDILS